MEQVFHIIMISQSSSISKSYNGKVSIGENRNKQVISCTAIINYAFECMNVRRIIAKCNPKNTQSWKLLERLKLRREGHLLKKEYFKCDLQGNPLWHDTYEYALLQEEWAHLLCEKVNSKVD